MTAIVVIPTSLLTPVITSPSTDVLSVLPTGEGLKGRKGDAGEPGPQGEDGAIIIPDAIHGGFF